MEPITLGFIQRHVEGFPLGGIWDKRLLGFEDANGNNVIEPSELQIGAEAEFRGSALPTRGSACVPGSPSSRTCSKLRPCSTTGAGAGSRTGPTPSVAPCSIYCRQLVDPSSSLEDQANAAAYGLGDADGNFTEWGFFEPAWFVKLRELSLTINAPAGVARALRASRASLTLSGRNLFTIDDYNGIDPEVNGFGQGREGGSNFAATDFFSQPQVRDWVARLNLSF